MDFIGITIAIILLLSFLLNYAAAYIRRKQVWTEFKILSIGFAVIVIAALFIQKVYFAV